MCVRIEMLVKVLVPGIKPREFKNASIGAREVSERWLSG